jgi:hypothetical protein
VNLSRPGKRFVAVLALAAAVAGVLSVTLRAQESSFGVYSNDFVTFRYPSAWSPSAWSKQELHFAPMVYLSTERAGHDPCRTTSSSAGRTTSCSWPIDRLSANGVLVQWENRGYPGARVAAFPGEKLRVGGRAARLSVQRPGRCGGVGADETISVAIARPLARNWTQVDACLRGPKLAPLEQQVRALLASARFLTP